MPLSPARIPKDLGLQLPLKPLAINFLNGENYPYVREFSKDRRLNLRVDSFRRSQSATGLRPKLTRSAAIRR